MVVCGRLLLLAVLTTLDNVWPTTTGVMAYYFPPEEPFVQPTPPQVRAANLPSPPLPVVTSTVQTTTTDTAFHPADLKLDVRDSQPAKATKPLNDDSSILFPGGGGTECNEAGTTCLAIDKCPSESRGRTICGWEETLPLVCCRTNSNPGPKSDTNISDDQTGLLLTKEIFPEAQCFRPKAVTGVASRKKRQFFPDIVPLGDDVPAFNPTVVGGVDVKSSTRWPFMVAVYKQVGRNSAFHCGGVVIGRSYAISAAHCFMDRSDDAKYLIRSGMYDLGSVERLDVDIKVFQVEQVIAHQDFKFPVLYNDIAIIRYSGFKTFSDTFRPICLPSLPSNLQLDTGNATVLGWGAKASGEVGSQILQEASVQLVGRAACDKAYQALGPIIKNSFPQGIIENQVCAGNVNRSKDACQGDSGGPLVTFDEQSNTWRLLGVVSVGYECGKIGFPGIYTRVQRFLPWINQTVTSA